VYLRGVARVVRTIIVAVLISSAMILPGCTNTRSTSTTSPTATPSAAVEPTPTPPPVVFAIIGDYGINDEHERAVADLVASWRPSYIVATGDDYYAPAGGKGAGKYEASTGKYYDEWLAGSPSGKASENAFFPVMGNHDYSDATPSPKTYLDYFDLPGEGFTNTSGNERYYDFVEGPIHFFMVNSNPDEPDNVDEYSKQAEWLKAQLAASTSRFNLVVEHHPPYSSDESHGSTDYMRWPFGDWGADAVFSGHAHAYERIQRGGIVYFVNGLGGASRYGFGSPVKGSKKRFSSDWGAQKVTVAEDALTLEFYDVSGTMVDSYRLKAKR